MGYGELVICKGCAVSEKTDFMEKSCPGRCLQDDGMGAESSMIKRTPWHGSA